jgi:hypothetical protein
VLWIFGSPRSGSTWLLNMLGADPQVAKLDEPGIGMHLGMSIEGVVGLDGRDASRFRVLDFREESADYFFSREQQPVWGADLRRMILRRFGAALGDSRLLAVKEPHGSDAADLLLSVMPRSRMIFLLRDGRDVVDSELDAAGEGSWAMRQIPGHAEVSDRLSYNERRARTWIRRTEVVERAYDAHPPDLRRLVRYEDLRAEPAKLLAELAAWLELDAAALERAAAESAFERLPDDVKGPGQFARAATPGLWRQNLSSEEQDLLEGIVGPKLSQLYSS